MLGSKLNHVSKRGYCCSGCGGQGLTLIKTWKNNSVHIKFEVKSLINCQISTVQPFKFGNGWGMSFHTSLSIWLLIHTEIILACVSKMRRRSCAEWPSRWIKLLGARCVPMMSQTALYPDAYLFSHNPCHAEYPSDNINVYMHFNYRQSSNISRTLVGN